MKSFMPFFAFISVVIASNVLEFTDSNFDTSIREHDIVLVEFFAPWCGVCKRLAPDYEKAATILKYDDIPVPLAKMDCTVEKSTCDKFDVYAYPTLKIFRKGKLSGTYNEPKDLAGIVKYMRSQSRLYMKNLTTINAVTKFSSSPEHCILGFFSEASNMKDHFLKVVDTLLPDYRFGFSTNKEVLNHFKYEDDIVILRPLRLQSKFEDSLVKYEGDSTLHNIVSFIGKNLHGLVGVRSTINQNQFHKPLIVVYYDVDYVKNPKGSNYWRNRVMKIAKSFEGRGLTMAVSNKDDFMSELGEYGIDTITGHKPKVAGQNIKNQTFVMLEEFTIENFHKFVQDFLDNKLKPYLKVKALPTPPKKNGSPVTIVETKNFDEIVNDKSKDVLIKFYGPWCVHCKTLSPIYDTLGEMLIDDPNIVIAKMDAVANIVPAQYKLVTYPTIYFVPKNQKDNPKKYEGGGEVDQFIEFLANESTEPLKNYDRNGKRKIITKTEL